MKFLKVLLTLLIIYPLFFASSISANTISPAINRVRLAQGQRSIASLDFQNSQNMDLEIVATPYAYNPKTDEISSDKEDIFLRVDTDTFNVKRDEKINIKYEIIPISNLSNGTYFNIIALTPVIENQDIQINASISQLVILDIVDTDNDVKGIVTTDYSTNIQLVNRGIPFLTPLRLKYSITNASNYVLTPQGRIDVFNEKNTYKPTYIYVNKEEQHLYPEEVLEDNIQINSWHISDIFTKRIVLAQITNGLDSNSQSIEVEIRSYIIEIAIILTLLLLSIILFKYVIQKKTKEKENIPTGNKQKKKKQINRVKKSSG